MPVVAVVGASNDRRKYGNIALRAFRNQGYEVVPINPREERVEGHRAYRSILDVPGPVDEATLYVPAEVGLQVIEEIAQKGVVRVWLNPGADDPRVVAKARALGLEALVACSIVAVS